MPAFDLETTYLGLDGVGGVTAMAGGAAFWASVGENPGAWGTIVTVGTGEGDWTRWEMHPKGDEVLVVLEGSVRMILDRNGAEHAFDLTPGSTLVVPTGVWHRAVDQKALRMLFITYGAGTEHRLL